MAKQRLNANNACQLYSALCALLKHPMKVADLRKDVKSLSKPILEELGFRYTGELGEHYRITDSGDKHAILFELLKRKTSYSISLRIFAYYNEVESVFQSVPACNSYTLSKILSCGSIPIENYSLRDMETILKRMIREDANLFFTEYGNFSGISTNLKSDDYKTWVTSDKAAQVKVKLALAIINDDEMALKKVLRDADKYISQPWSEPDRNYIEMLCKSVQTST